MSNASSCFFPDGTSGASISPQFVPCDPSAPQTACCAAGETCVGNNLCLSVNGLIYRGGCTDRTFENSACPSLCTSSSGRNAGPQDSWTFLKPCDASTGSLQWMCSLSGDCTNSSLRFNLQVGGPREVNITGDLVTSSSTSSISPTSTASTSNTFSTPLPTLSSTNECQTTKGTSVTAVGAGVAIPLGILLLLALVWGFWERRKRTITNTRVAGQDYSTQQDYSTVVVTENKYNIPQEAPTTVVISELPATLPTS